MNTQVLKGKWHQIKGRAKEQWGELTDNDLDKIEGESERFLGILQERYGWEKTRARRELDDFLKKYN